MPENTSISFNGVRPMLAMPINRDLPPATVTSLLDTAIAFMQNRISLDFNLAIGQAGVEKTRSMILDQFLRSQATHLLHVDSDMVWRPEDAVRIVALATRMECVAATYRQKTEPERWSVRPLGQMTANEFGCIPVRGLGLGFCCVQRSLLEDLAAKAPRMRVQEYEHEIAAVFRTGKTAEGMYMSEDMCFFEDIRRLLGAEVWLDPNIDLGHVGSKDYRGSFAEYLKTCKVEKGQDDEHETNQRRGEEAGDNPLLGCRQATG